MAIFTLAGRHLQLEDGLIYDRYILNALHGFGLVYNVGERVNGLTSPLYTYPLFAVSWLIGGHVQTAVVLIFGVTFAGACLLAEELVPYSGILLGSMGYFYILIGMESSLLLFLLMLVVSLYIKDRLLLLPTVVMLLCLTRYEAGAMALVLGWKLWRTRRFPPIVSFVPPALIGIVYLTFNLVLYGSLIPDSGKAKLGQGMSGYWGAWPTAFLHIWKLWRFFEYTPYILLGMVVFAYYGVKRTKDTPWASVVLPFLCILFIFYWLTNVPAYYWYYSPFVFCLTMFAVAGLPKKTWIVPAFAVVLVIQATTNLVYVYRYSNEIHQYARIGDWIARNTREDATIASCEIGEIGWRSHRYMYDILGLTTPKNAAYVAHRDTTSWFPEDHPDFVIVHQPAWRWEQVVVADPTYKDVSLDTGNIRLFCKAVPSSVGDAGLQACAKVKNGAATNLPPLSSSR